MIHGHHFNFIDEPALNDARSSSFTESTITVQAMSDTSLLNDYPMQRPWVPLSGREGQYFSKTVFEEADEHFSWGLRIKNVLSLVWVPGEQSIYYSKEEHYTAQRLQFWIYHTFFPMVVELNRSAHMLHVGAVEIHSQPVLFSALSFGGKSTLTDFFIQKGHTLLSDDSLGIQKRDGLYCAIPSYPFHRPFREPETLGLAAKNFTGTVKPLKAVFLLNRVEADAEVVVVPLKGIEKFKAFHESIFIEFPFRKKERFAFFGEMAKEVPVYRIDIPWDLERLEEVYHCISRRVSIYCTT